MNHARCRAIRSGCAGRVGWIAVAAAPWLNLTADLQIINPGLQKTLGSDGRLRDVDITVVAGLRLNVRF